MELAERLLALPEQDRPEAVLCFSGPEAEWLIEAFRAHGLPLEGAGAANRGLSGAAHAICSSGSELGTVAADLLLSRLLRPDRPYLKVGVGMTFIPSPSKSVLETVAHNQNAGA